MYYLLDKDKKVVPCTKQEWCDFIEMRSNNFSKHVKNTFLNDPHEAHISTVFLGLDHNWCEDGEILVFETMIFWDDMHELDQYQERYSTYDEALKGHRRAVRAVIKE